MDDVRSADIIVTSPNLSVMYLSGDQFKKIKSKLPKNVNDEIIKRIKEVH